MERSRSYIATPPGATIKEQIATRDMNQKEFAARMGMSEKHISKLVNGEVRLTMDVARRLEMVLGLPAQFWCNLEAIYREKLAKIDEENAMDQDKELARKIPYKEMVRNGWVEDTAKIEDRVINLRKFFEVAQLTFLQGNLVPGIACRKLSTSEKSDYALIAWAQKAKLESRKIQTQLIDIKTLKKILPQIRKMTMESPEEFCPKLIELLSSCGIAIIFLPHIGGSFLHGATFYDGNKIVLGLTLRGKDADKFWFSLFHELGHIILGHIGKVDGTNDDDENAADEFARDQLIPADEFEYLINNIEITKENIIDFAKQVGIDAGIVVGRLQKEGYLQYSWYNDLKTKYVLT
ncbi:MAG: helix-turn-helix domain-containing protein [Clostridiales bacterium]|nr:helix-turn-helix domain-containing protein [Clostridiales bacterium]